MILRSGIEARVFCVAAGLSNHYTLTDIVSISTMFSVDEDCHLRRDVSMSGKWPRRSGPARMHCPVSEYAACATPSQPAWLQLALCNSRLLFNDHPTLYIHRVAIAKLVAIIKQNQHGRSMFTPRQTQHNAHHTTHHTTPDAHGARVLACSALSDGQGWGGSV